VAKFFIKLSGKSGIVALVASVAAAALSAKGIGLFHTDGFFDGR
jgi:uncharacterized membrane protein (DUF441 family)